MQIIGKKYKEDKQDVLRNSLNSTPVGDSKKSTLPSLLNVPLRKHGSLDLKFNEPNKQKKASSHHHLHTTRRLNLLREQIRTGTYHIDYYSLADKLLDFI